MDVRFINPFIVAVKNVFQTMLNTTIVISKPVLKAPDEQNADVSAVIGLSGDAVGSVVLSFPMPTAIKAASQFAGIGMDPSHPDFSDALGELANMVAGQGKAQLEGMNVSISLPTVIVGQEHTVSRPRQAARLVLPCDSVLGSFCVEVAILIPQKDVIRSASAGEHRAVTASA